MERPIRDVKLAREGLVIGGERVPLYAGSVHYWRLDPRDWRACLTAIKGLGLRLVDTYVPWSVHEVAPGVLELGDTDPRRDVAQFLRLAHELGLYAIVRPGPHINAELTYFGIPERIVWDPACQARSPNQNPVVLPMLPQSFPVPSYASEVFLDETSRFYRSIAKTLVPLLYPDGPIVMLQVDNEGAMYFRDGPYDQDYHPDAIALYRSFLREKYKTLADLAKAYGEDATSEQAPRFGDIQPPTKFDAQSPSGLARHLDWAELHEHLLARAMQRFADSLSEAGLDGIPRSHNFPPGQEATPLNAARVRGAIDLVGYDYYAKAGPTTRSMMSRRTSELAVRSEALDVPAFACEMGAGFPPFFPPMDERDSMFTTLVGLAYGLRGFNLYMAVERDRWIGAPIDPHGRERPFALFWRRLIGALDEVDFPSLRRRVPVRIVIPRNERRLARVMHAFGPVSGAFFSVAGAGARESALEDDLGLGYPPAVEADTFVRMMESALEARGVPFGHVGGEDRDVSLDGASWIVCVTSGGLSPTLFGRLAEVAATGALVTVGPRAPELGGARRPLLAPLDLSILGPRAGVDVFCPADPASVDRAVSAAISALGLPTFAVDPDSVYATIHEDESGKAKLLFLINPERDETIARITVGAGYHAARDLLKAQRFVIKDGALEAPVRGKSVRMLALE
ncbi:MAG: beta-galactosidase [Myxococcales bacterium]|nr:beta-galactosidase [Myxococcales bacterium]